MLALVLVVGGATACSDDGDGGDGDTATTEDGGGGSGETGEATGSAEVDAYCAAVDAYVPIAQAAAADAGNVEKSQAATEAANGLAAPLAAVPEVQTLSPEAQAALEECQITAAEAGLPSG